MLLFFNIKSIVVIAILMIDYSCSIKLPTLILAVSTIHEMSDRNIIFKIGKYLEAFTWCYSY